MLKFYIGQINSIEVIALFSGVCKVNAAIGTQILIDVFGADMIINSGTAGGMVPDLEIFDTVISTEVCYHDVAQNILTEFHPWMKTIFFPADPKLIILSKNAVDKIRPAGKVVWGRMATGESFITDEGRQKINQEFAPLTVDMETASIAHVCYVNRIPFISIRCITDTDGLPKIVLKHFLDCGDISVRERRTKTVDSECICARHFLKPVLYKVGKQFLDFTVWNP